MREMKQSYKATDEHRQTDGYLEKIMMKKSDKKKKTEDKKIKKIKRKILKCQKN